MQRFSVSEKRVIIVAIVFIFIVNLSAFFFIKGIKFFGQDYQLLSVVTKKLGVKSIKKTNSYEFLTRENIKNHDYLAPWYVINSYKIKNFRPVSNFFLIIEHSFFGLNYYFYRIISCILNGILSVLLFFLLRLIFNRYKAALFGITIFSLHSYNTIIVSSLSGQSYQLAMIFGVLSLLLFVEYRKYDKKISMVFSLLFLILAILSREIALIFPIFFIGYDLIYRRNNKEDISRFIAGNSTYYIISGLIILGIISYYIYDSYGVIHGHNFFARGSELFSHIFYSLSVYLPGFAFNIPPIKFADNFYLILIIAFIFSVALYLPAFFNKKLRTKEFRFGFLIFIMSLIIVLPFEPDMSFVYMSLFAYAIFSTAYTMNLIKKFRRKWLFRVYALIFKILLPVAVAYLVINLDIKYYASSPQNQMIKSLLKIEDKIPQNANVYLFDTKMKDAQWDLIYGVRLYSNRNDYNIYPLTNFPYKKRFRKINRPEYSIEIPDLSTITIQNTSDSGFFYSVNDKKYISSGAQLKQGAEFSKKYFNVIIDYVGKSNKVKTVTFYFKTAIDDKKAVFLRWKQDKKDKTGHWVIQKFISHKTARKIEMIDKK